VEMERLKEIDIGAYRSFTTLPFAIFLVTIKIPFLAVLLIIYKYFIFE